MRHLGSYLAYGKNDLSYKFLESISDSMAYVTAHSELPYSGVAAIPTSPP